MPYIPHEFQTLYATAYDNSPWVSSRYFKWNILKTLYVASSPLFCFNKSVSLTIFFISVNIITVSLVSHTKINMLCLILRLFFILYIKFMCCHPCLLKYNQITPVLTAAVIFFIPEVWLKILIALHQSTQSYQESILYSIFKNDKWCLTLMRNASITSSSPLNGIHISYHSLRGPKLSTHCLTHQPCFFPSRLTVYSTWSLFRS